MSRRFVVRATGPARPGQTAALGTALASARVSLLDLNQHVGFGQVMLEALVEAPAERDVEVLLTSAGDIFGLECRVEPITPEVEARVRDRLEVPRSYLTLMGPTLSAEIVAEVGALVAGQGLTIERIKRLSGEASLEGAPDANGACLEWRLCGEALDAESLKTATLALGERFAVDIAIQPASVWRRQGRLVCFDMDSTLIQTEVIDELARRHGVFDEVAAITERAMRGELDFQQSFRERLQKLEGLDESVLQEVAESLPLMPGLERLMRILKRLGYRTAILSGGFTYFAHYLQERLGFDEVHANELVIRDGKVTGEVAEPIVDAERKALLLGQIAAREGWDLAQSIAVGDGANDLKMLAMAGMGVAFHAKPMVRQQARQTVSTLGLDALLYLLGYAQRELEAC